MKYKYIAKKIGSIQLCKMLFQNEIWRGLQFFHWLCWHGDREHLSKLQQEQFPGINGARGNAPQVG